jgi:hypothetical protein
MNKKNIFRLSFVVLAAAFSLGLVVSSTSADPGSYMSLGSHVASSTSLGAE